MTKENKKIKEIKKELEWLGSVTTETGKQRVKELKKELKNQIYNKSDVIKNVDDDGRLLTYQIVDFFRPELQPSGIVKEFNTLKELNLWLKKQEENQVPNKIAEMQEDFKMETQEKQIGKYDVSVFENIGKYYVKVEDSVNDTEAKVTFVAEYEAQENFSNLDTEEDCEIFMKEEIEYQEGFLKN